MNPFNLMQALMQIKQNPMAILGQRFNIPQNLSNPNDIIQHLLNTGQVTQEQVNQEYNQVMQMRNSPMFKNLR